MYTATNTASVLMIQLCANRRKEYVPLFATFESRRKMEQKEREDKPAS
jgi:hypothetical protein